MPRDFFKWEPGASSARLRDCLVDPASFRRYLRVSPTAQIIAVLNARDDFLDAIWSGDRAAFYGAMKAAGVTLVTGPTFSIYAESFSRPAFHNVTASRFHHRMIQEMHDAGLAVAPNVYWRNEVDIGRMSAFLRSVPVQIISRDFSRTKHPSSFEEHVRGLVRVLSAVDRPLELLLVGLGPGKAQSTVRRLTEAGASCTVVSPVPILTAIKRGSALLPSLPGKLREVRNLEVPRQTLALRNMNSMQRFLLEGSPGGEVNAEFAFRRPLIASSAA